MTIINDSLVQLWSCLLCGWQGREEDLHETYNDKHGQTELVCPECSSRENPYQ